MTDGKDKRRDPRVPLVLRVDYPGEPAVRDATENLSAGGLFIRTEAAPAVGQRMALQIGFPGLLEPLEIEVEVVRHRAPSAQGPGGVAVRIPVDRVGDRHKLARLVETARFSGGNSPRAYRILVVEDNPWVVAVYDRALQQIRADDAALLVEYAPEGEAALARMRSLPAIDLVLTDLFMPVMDGFALLERVRADPALASTPVLVVSGGGPDARERATQLGVDAYLQKPVPFASVIDTVRTLLRIGAR